MDWILLAGIALITIAVGFFLGKFMAFIKGKLYLRKILKQGRDVLNGKRPNRILNLDGKEVDVNRFKLLDDKGNIVTIGLDGKILPEKRFFKPLVTLGQNNQDEIEEKLNNAPAFQDSKE